MNYKRVILICIIIIFLQVIFKLGIVQAEEYNSENINSYSNNELYCDTEDIENYSEDYKKYLQLTDEEKEKIRSNTKKI